MSLPVPPREPDSVPVLNSTPLPAFTQSWQLKPPEDALILIVKGTFNLRQAKAAVPSEEFALPLGPEVFEGAEEAVRYPGDMALFKPRCDVLVAGHAYRNVGGAAVRRVEIRLGTELSLALAAIGDRRWVRGVPSEPAPFEKIELRPERAYGGPGDPENPVGVGRVVGEGSPLPNFELADRLIRSPRDQPPAAMTTPVAQTWPARAKLAGTYSGDWVKKRAPYFPDDFRWDYFQAAPRALQIAYPRGDEWYRLMGVRPDDEVLEGKLPSLTMRGFAQPLERPGELTELPLNLDTVFFEPDLLRVQLVWRGAIRVVDQFASDLASVFVVAEPIGQPVSMEEVARRFAAAYTARFVRTPEETEPDLPEPTPSPPEGRAAPLGMDAARAMALGLPAWAATIESPPLPPVAPPRPSATVVGADLDAALGSERSLVEADLSYCDLRGRDLRGRDLTKAILIGAQLDGANLSGARLAGATLREASLPGVDLTGADLTEAALDVANLEGANLQGATLRQATFASARAANANFNGATLDGAVGYEADLARATFDGARLVFADLSAARLEDASFLGAQMDDVRLYDVVAPRMIADDAQMNSCRLDGGTFVGSSFARVVAPSSSMRRCDFSDCNWMEAVLEGSVLEDTVLDRANVNQVEAKECRWQRARASEATFVKSNLMRGGFAAVSFTSCDLRGANLYDCDTFRARFDKCLMDHAILGVSGLE